MLNPNKKYKYGQIVTINNSIYRIQKCKYASVFSTCMTCQVICLGPALCGQLMPLDANLKFIRHINK